MRKNDARFVLDRIEIVWVEDTANSGGVEGVDYVVGSDGAHYGIEPYDDPKYIGGTAPIPTIKGVKAAYSVYKGIKNGKTVYWGLTNNFTRRAAEHAGRFDDVVEVYSGLSKQAARGLEQMMIDKFGINALQNVRNGIGVNNPKMMQYYQKYFTVELESDIKKLGAKLFRAFVLSCFPKFWVSTCMQDS